MSAQYTALILVMIVSAIVLVVGKPLFTRFMAVKDFRRRRNFWLVLTAAAFLAPSIWLYVLVAAPVLIYGARKDPNPAALYLFLLLAVPPLRVQIPTLDLIGQIFPMDHLRLLSLALLLPVALRLRAGRTAPFAPADPTPGVHAITVVDLLLLAYLALQVLVLLPYVSMTTSMRQIVLLAIDVALPYFVLSRACRNREMIAEAMAAFVMAVVVLVPLAVFEFFWGWMLYAGIGNEWGADRIYFPLHRGDFLRALTTAGHSINLGSFMAVAFGMWLYLQGRCSSPIWRWLGFLTLLTGLVVTLARGPWVGAVAILFFYLSLGPRAGSRLLQGLAVAGGLFAVVLVSPWSAQIIDYLPFAGTIDSNTIVMRQHLAEGAWVLIQQNPIFGSPYFLASMEAFRTGEGIIDLVNTYAAVALSLGLAGLGLFVGIFVALLWKAGRVVRELAGSDPDFSLMGAALIACIVGTLIVIATTSFQLALPSVTWALVGLTLAYVRLPAPRVLATFRVAPVHTGSRQGIW